MDSRCWACHAKYSRAQTGKLLWLAVEFMIGGDGVKRAVVARNPVSCGAYCIVLKFREATSSSSNIAPDMKRKQQHRCCSQLGDGRSRRRGCTMTTSV